MTEMADWESNARQGVGLPSDHYDRAMDISRRASRFPGSDHALRSHRAARDMPSRQTASVIGLARALT